MSREHKFRAWHNGKMFRPFSMSWYIEGNLVETKWDDRPLSSRWPKGTIFLQYTGLKDKNGKEIYEGDIVNWFNTFKDRKRIGIIECDIEDGMRFGIRCQRDSDSIWNFDFASHVEIIGDIYENPELINKND